MVPERVYCGRLWLCALCEAAALRAELHRQRAELD